MKANTYRALDELRLRAKVEAELIALRDFEKSLGKSPRDALEIAKATMRMKYPRFADTLLK